MFSRFAMNVSRLSPTAATGEVSVASRAWLFARNGVWMFHHVLAEVRRAARGVVRRGDGRLAEVLPVQVGLRHTERVVDQHHLIVLRHEGDGRRLVLRGDLIEGLRGAGPPPVDRSGASNGVQPIVGSRKESSSRLSLPLTIGRAGQGGLVGRVVLRGLAVGGQQVCRGHVVAGVLVNHIEVARGQARLARLRGEPVAGWRACRPPWPGPRPEELGAVAERHLPEDGPAEPVHAAALAQRVRRGAHLSEVRAVEAEVDGDNRVAGAASARPGRPRG